VSSLADVALAIKLKYYVLPADNSDLRPFILISSSSPLHARVPILLVSSVRFPAIPDEAEKMRLPASTLSISLWI